MRELNTKHLCPRFTVTENGWRRLRPTTPKDTRYWTLCCWLNQTVTTDRGKRFANRATRLAHPAGEFDPVLFSDLEQKYKGKY
jgi:hypothetical protein